MDEGEQLLLARMAVSLWIGVLLATPTVVLSGEFEHRVRVVLDPLAHTIDVVDEFTIPDWNGDPVTLVLHEGLAPEVEGDYALEKLERGAEDRTQSSGEMGSGIRFEEFTLRSTGDLSSPPILRYSGKIHHDLQSEGEEYAGSFSRTPGTIQEEGVVLSMASGWLPRVGDGLLRFRIEAEVPAGWDVVSQGKRVEHERDDRRTRVVWQVEHPMDDAYLIAGKFYEFSRPAGNVMAQAFLREDDANLAAKYLEATAQYVEMYRKLIGAYPFQKFALVENFWETGYGMPSFTLLGPRVIRMPFILHSSYPHEILHNWWGNSVYVDYEQGNWCEGLTAYLADHLIKEGRGQGTGYRRDRLAGYRNYVREGLDFPLRDFRSRHSASTQAVGYGKSMMLFHMLRKRVGDDKFRLGLQRFYRSYRFQRASFDDIAKVFSEVAEEDLTTFFRQWVDRTGAPILRLGDVTIVADSDGGGQLHIEVTQEQVGEPYELHVPVVAVLQNSAGETGERRREVFTLAMNDKSATLEVPLERPVVRVEVDPAFDVFRRVHIEETPSALSQMFGAEKVTMIVPETDPHGVNWPALAEAWGADTDERIQVVGAGEIDSLPPDRAVWVLGFNNPWRSKVLDQLGRTKFRAEPLTFGSQAVSNASCVIATCRHPLNSDLALAWVAVNQDAAIPGLARKLPHYGKYSYLAFEGDEPTNIAKGQWPTDESPMTQTLPAATEEVAVPTATRLPEVPLARPEPVFDPTSLRQHVEFLAADEMEGRGAGSEGLTKAADYIAKAFAEMGLEPGGDAGADGARGWFQSWKEPDGPSGAEVELKNVIGVLRGSRTEWSEQSVVLGAHYDHLGRGWPDVRAGEEGQVHNGADDNASGISVMIEVARLLKRTLEPGRTIVFVAFSGEEWDLKGSRRYVDHYEPWPAKKALAVVNMDSVGRLEGRKILVLGSGTATEWVHIARGVGFTTGIESQCIADDPGGSDQKSFHQIGVPAVQIFSGLHDDYHRPSDDIEKVDVAGMIKVAAFVRETIAYLGDRERPMTSTLSESSAKKPEASTGSRRVSFGSVPDFVFQGPGVRLTGVSPGSPAEKAQFQKGDILLTIDDHELKSLRDFSNVLKKYKPGDRVTVKYRRGDEESVVEVELTAR